MMGEEPPMQVFKVKKLWEKNSLSLPLSAVCLDTILLKKLNSELTLPMLCLFQIIT